MNPLNLVNLKIKVDYYGNLYVEVPEDNGTVTIVYIAFIY